MIPAASMGGERYPAGWRRTDGTAAGGVLVLGAHGLQLEGRRGGGETAERVPYGSIAAVRVGRALDERVDGRPSIVVEQRDRPALLIAPRGIGLVSEITDLLAALMSSVAKHGAATVVIAPLRKGAAEQARELVGAGPPVDLEELGVTRHQVFLTEHEAVFVFSGNGVEALLDNGFRSPRLWRALLAWRRLLAGSPRVATLVYAWPPR